MPQTTMAGTDQVVAMIVPSSLRLKPHRLLSLYTLLQVAGDREFWTEVLAGRCAALGQPQGRDTANSAL